MHLKIGLIVLLCSGLSLVQAQSNNNILDFDQTAGVKVIVGNDSLANPWAGGLNGVSVNNIDLNLDGQMDLLIYEKSSRSILPFISKPSSGTTKFHFAPEYKKHFPVASSWMIIKDYNCDGKEDVFYNIGSRIHVLENTSSAGKFSLTDPLGGAIQVNVNSGSTSLYSSEGDKPALVDIDDDGDLDFFSFSSSGSVAQFNENMTNCGLNFTLRETCWGFFTEGGLYRSVSLDACVPFGRKAAMHSGSSMLILDLNGDGLKDLLLGNVSYPDITALYNTGSLDSTHFTSQDTLFPTYDQPIVVHDFPALSDFDANLDGKKDLVASPFSLGSGFEDVRSVHLYLNTGTSSNPVFAFESDDFMQSGMIDLGTGAVPRLIDLNSDAKPDLVISNTEENDGINPSRHFYHFYKNTGSFGAPEFTLMDTNLANISSYGLGSGTIPTFADLDGDGDKDMIVGDANGQLHYFTNNSFVNPAFTLHTAGVGGIDVGQNAAPFLFDLDQDGDFDLLVGNNSGVLHYYENSSASSPNFSLVNDFFGAVNVYTNTSSSGRSIPYIYQNDSIVYLMVGSSDAGIFQFDSVAQVIDQPNELNATFGNAQRVSTGFEETPFGISKRNGRNQFLIRASELRAMGLSYGFITRIAFDVTTTNNTTIWQGVSIRCKLTTDSTLTNFHSGLTEVRNSDLSGSVGLAQGWNDLHFSKAPFLWDGQSNLIIDVCFGGQSSGSNIQVNMTDVGFASHAIGDLINNSLDHSLGCVQPYKRSINERPDMKLAITPSLVETNRFEAGYAHTAPALDDLDLDGFPDMLTGNRAGGLNFFQGKQSTIGLNEVFISEEKKLMAVYPNPGTAVFHVEVIDYGQARLKVFDLTGSMILERDLKEPVTPLDLSYLKRGMYLFILETGQKVQTEKVLIH